MDDNIRNAIRQSAESLLQHAHGNFFVTRAARERLLHHIEITTVCTAVEKGYPEKENSRYAFTLLIFASFFASVVPFPLHLPSPRSSI
mmetsp:Transcript_22958/g.58233  ORF Transcript_22958/g.58233 Transcript_22958/m.58233 type:complete len:88 (-) Transcript_22958:386-649(-)